MMDVSVWKVRGNKPHRAKNVVELNSLQILGDRYYEEQTQTFWEFTVALRDKESTGKPCQ